MSYLPISLFSLLKSVSSMPEPTERLARLKPLNLNPTSVPLGNDSSLSEGLAYTVTGVDTGTNTPTTAA